MTHAISRSVVAALAIASVLAARASAQAPPPGPQLTRPPELLEFVPAPYPESEAASPREAAVTLRLTIDAEGAVTEVEVVSSAGEAFDSAAVLAARQFRFRPAEVDGVPAPIRILYEYRFTVEVAREEVTTATLTGTVRDRRTRVGVPGVEVRVGEEVVVTDADGRFEREGLTPGPTRIGLSGPGLTPVFTEETLAAGERLEVVYDVTLAEPRRRAGARRGTTSRSSSSRLRSDARCSRPK